eukprot:XP_011417436.1 PREDICTED: E3 ubiquitin-protein ligase arc-1-like [Crassostrea gigas]
MEQRSTAQDVHRCYLCETIVHSYCDFCHVNLCKPCIGEHISDGYDKHKIVPFKDRRSTLIYPKCKAHAQENCKFQCKDCDISVCSSCMASEQHRGHIFIEISEVYEKRKRLVENDIRKLEETFSPKYKEKALYFETQLSNLDRIYEKLTAEITRHGEQWHGEIDIIINKMKTKTSEKKEKHRDKLLIHLDEIKQQQDLMKKALLALRDITKSNEMSQTIEYMSTIGRFSRSLQKVKITSPTFKSAPIDREQLLTLFGHITPMSITHSALFYPLFSYRYFDQ